MAANDSDFEWSQSVDMFNNRMFSDVIVQFGKHQIHAHKVILSKHSIYFRKAFTGHFSVASSPVIDLGDEDDPDLVRAMIQHLYSRRGEYYPSAKEGMDPLQFHTDVYMLGDKYDVESLRMEALNAFSGRAVLDIGAGSMARFSLHISRICGPSAVRFADTRLQNGVFDLCVAHSDRLLQSKVFLDMCKEGSLFDVQFANRFSLELGRLYLRQRVLNLAEINLALQSSTTCRNSGSINFFDTQQFSDIIIQYDSGNKKMFAHKIILASHSSYFRAVFDEDPSINMVNIDDVSDPRLVEVMMRYIYDCDHDSKGIDLDVIPDDDWIKSDLDMYLIGRKYGIGNGLHGVILSCFNDGAADELYAPLFALGIARLCGPSSEFKDTRLQTAAFDLCIEYSRVIVRENDTFVKMLEEGTLFDLDFTRRFALEVARLVL